MAGRGIRWVDMSGFGAGIADAYIQGKDRRLREEDAKSVQSMRQAQMDQMRTATAEKEAEAARGREIIGQRVMLDSVGRLEKVAASGNAQAYEQVAMAESKKVRGVLGRIDPALASQIPDIVPMDQLGNMGQGLRAGISKATDPKSYRDWEAKAAATLAAEVGDETLNDPQFARGHGGWRKALSVVLADDVKKGSSNVNVGVNMPGGAQPLTKQNTNKVQGELIESKEELLKLNKLIADAKPEQFTYLAEGKQWAAGKLSRLNPDWVPGDWATEASARKKVFASAEQGFVINKIKATGAAGPPEGVEQLRAAYLNSDLPWHEFAAMAEQAQEGLGRAVRIRNRLLAKGLDISSDGFGAQLDEMYASGASADSDDDAKARLDQLKKMGMASYEAVRTMTREGY